MVICLVACDQLRPCYSFLTYSFFSCKDRALERDRPNQRGKKKTYGRLECHVSGARRPRLATSLRASIWDVTEGRDVLFDDEALSMHGFCSCFGCCLIFKPCWAMDLTSIAVLQLRHLILPAEAVIHWRNHPGWDENINVAYNPRYIGSD